MQLLASSSRAAFKQCHSKASGRSYGSRKLVVPVRAAGDYDRDTGFIAEDNSGRANIFPRKQQAYLKSSTSDAAARQGLGGLQGGILVGFVIAAVVAATVLTSKAPGPETLQSVGGNFQGDSLTSIAKRIESTI